MAGTNVEVGRVVSGSEECSNRQAYLSRLHFEEPRKRIGVKSDRVQRYTHISGQDQLLYLKVYLVINVENENSKNDF